jgi:hypothetical protein
MSGGTPKRLKEHMEEKGCLFGKQRTTRRQYCVNVSVKKNLSDEQAKELSGFGFGNVVSFRK